MGVYLEIEPNENSRDSVSMRFKELGPPRPIRQVRITDQPGGPVLCWVTGWRDDPKDPLCPALAQKVEESGMGQAFLVYGGNCGVRFKPASLNEAWDLTSPNQWGEPFLLLGSAQALVFEDGA